MVPKQAQLPTGYHAQLKLQEKAKQSKGWLSEIIFNRIINHALHYLLSFDTEIFN